MGITCLLTHLSLRHRIHPNIPKTLTRTSTLQSDFQRAEHIWCKQGKSAEAEWTSELQSESLLVANLIVGWSERVTESGTAPVITQSYLEEYLLRTIQLANY